MDKIDVTYCTVRLWGVDRRYPLSDWAKRLCHIAGTKTLTDDLIDIIRKWSDVQLNLVLDPEVLRKEVRND